MFCIIYVLDAHTSGNAKEKAVANIMIKYHNLHSPTEHRKKRRRRLRMAAAMMLCAFLAGVCGFQARCAGVRKELLRLHVIANSDSERDQYAKLQARDALLTAGADLFDGSVDTAQAQAVLIPRKEELERCAKRTLEELGLDYPVRIVIGEEYFNTRTYEDTSASGEANVTLPAGRYQAVRVILGRGEGQNWWCVMFPPLCLPAARPKNQISLDAVLTAGQLRLVKSNPRLEVRFKIVELWEGLLEKLRKRP